MEEKIIKDIIDKLLIDEISEDEMRYVLEKIKSNEQLQAYYNETLKIKEQLQSISDTQPFQDAQLEASRNQLFDSLPNSRFKFTYFHMAAAMLISIVSTALIMAYTQQNTIEPDNGLVSQTNTQEYQRFVDGDIISLNVENISNERVVFSGKAVKNFQISGFVNDDRIQNLIRKTALKDPNLNNRLKAVNLMSRDTDSDHLLMDLIRNNDDNSLIRLQALNRLAESSSNDNMASTYINLLKEENDRRLQQKLLELIKQHESKEQIFNDLKMILESTEKEDLKNMLKKELMGN